jgi:transcription initiation factor TFIIF subunit beta
MLLNSNIAEHQNVPKEYNLELTNQNVKNTFIFSEQDLPGFKSKSRQKFDLETANMPARLTRAKIEKPAAKQPWDPNRRFQPQYRKAIPSTLDSSMLLFLLIIECRENCPCRKDCTRTQLHRCTK